MYMYSSTPLKSCIVIVRSVVFNTTFNNMSALPRENHQPMQFTDKLYHIMLTCIEYTSIELDLNSQH